MSNPTPRKTWIARFGLAAVAVVALGFVGVSPAAADVEIEPFNPPSYPMGSQPFFLQAADFNGDGYDDLVATDSPFDRVAVLLNEGDASFSATALYPAGDDPGQMDVGDLNGDDLPDLALINGDINSISVLLNVNGGFPTFTTYPMGDIPSSISIGDVNDDGAPDIAVANINDGVMFVMHNDGAGGFTVGQTLVVGEPGDLRSLKVADINEDGHGDIAVTRSGVGEIALLFGDGSGTFAFVTPYVTGSNPSKIDLRDMNGDGHLDLFIYKSIGAGHTREIRTGVGNGTFTDWSLEGFGPFLTSSAFADIDDDGDVDIVSSLQWTSDPNSIIAEINEGNGEFDSEHLITTGNLQWVAIGRFGTDDTPGLAAANREIGTLDLWSIVPEPDEFPPSLQLFVDSADAVALTGWYNAESSGTDGVKVDVFAQDTMGVRNITCTSNGVEVLNLAVSAETYHAVVTLGDGNHALSCTASDRFNTSEPETMGLPVDQTAPTINGSVSPDPVPVGGTAIATAGASDATSGVATSGCSAPSTGTLGVKTLSCTATDVAGNEAQGTVEYRVGFAFGGFQEPIPQMSYRAGSTVPVKFTLRDHTGALISDADAQALVAACLVRVTLDGVLQPGCATYSARSDQFSYNVKIPKGMTGQHVVALAVSAPNGSGIVNSNSVTITVRR
ncbi:FG-GAP-like repeat-containing protein [Agromyces sp. NPDC056523]|uniref:FG-GAP-like repeat-containing protein n=1 Tax=Agromyces sp. NPDC056523 TaxID=3345850 RepID=UPI00366BBD04